MHVRTLFLSLTVLLSVCLTASGQDKPVYKERKKPEDFWKDTFVAINLTPSLGGNQLGAYISPTFGYHFTENFNAAAGPLYMFNIIQNGNIRTSASIWGGRVWTQYRIYQPFFAHAEYEVMNAIQLYAPNGVPQGYLVNTNGDFFRKFIGNPLLGLAYVNEGDRASQSVTVLYNLNHNPSFTPYSTLLNAPIVIRATLSFDLGKE